MTDNKLTKRKLSDADRNAIREQLADGIPRGTIADELDVTLKQVDAIRAHVTMSDRKKRLTDAEMLRRAHGYASARARAKKLKCLTFSECETIWAEQGGVCAISGTRFSDKQANRTAKILSRPLRPSLDRINPKKGYERGNVRLVTQIVNFGLGEWPLEVFREMCRQVAAKIAAV